MVESFLPGFLAPFSIPAADFKKYEAGGVVVSNEYVLSAWNKKPKPFRDRSLIWQGGMEEKLGVPLCEGIFKKLAWHWGSWNIVDTLPVKQIPC